MTNDNMDLRQHSPVTALEWDSYPFSDGDWSPCTVYEHFIVTITSFLTKIVISADLCGLNLGGE